jgi:hypothetical protein
MEGGSEGGRATATFPHRVSIYGTDRGIGNVGLKGTATPATALAVVPREVTLGDEMEANPKLLVLKGWR